MKARLCSNITFYQVLTKIKIWLANGYCMGKSDDVTNDDVM